MLSEFLGYIVGSVVGLLLLAGLMFLLMHRPAGLKAEPLLVRYVRHVVGPPQRATRFLLYGLVAILIAGLVISLPASAQVRELARSVFPWLVVVYGLLALAAFVRWAKHQ